MDSATRISYIKAHRSEFGSDLKTAKMAVDNGWFPGQNDVDPHRMEAALRRLKTFMEVNQNHWIGEQGLEFVRWGLGEVE